MPNYLVPTDTKKILDDHAGKCQNLGLILARYVPAEAIYNRENWSDDPKRDKRMWREGWLQDKVCATFNLEQRDTDWQKLCKASHHRWSALTSNAERFSARLRGRLIVGLGAKGVLEFGLTLDHVTGLPIIPGSALKGICRAYALLVIAAQIGVPVLTPAEVQKRKNEKKEKHPSWLQMLDVALTAEDEAIEESLKPLAAFNVSHARLYGLREARLFRAAFGSNERAGKCVFYDAFVSGLPPIHPQRSTLFRLDVMTPHFSEYYRSEGGQAPHDADKPNPVSFLTISEGTLFDFAIGLRRPTDEARLAQQQALEWLKLALTELGVGSKLAAGYGVFELL